MLLRAPGSLTNFPEHMLCARQRSRLREHRNLNIKVQLPCLPAAQTSPLVLSEGGKCWLWGARSNWGAGENGGGRPEVGQALLSYVLKVHSLPSARTPPWAHPLLSGAHFPLYPPAVSALQPRPCPTSTIDGTFYTWASQHCRRKRGNIHTAAAAC